MLHHSKIFFLTLFISYIGSLQIGPIGVIVMHTALKFNFRSAMKVAFVGIIPEYIYSFLAFAGYSIIAQNSQILLSLQIAAIPLFLLLGIFNVLKPEKISQVEITSVRNNQMRAFRYGILNPLLLSFWVLSLLIIDKSVAIQSNTEILVFVLATGTGGFLTKCTFAWLSLRYKQHAFTVFKRFSVNKIIGMLFLLGALVQLVKVVL